MASSPPGVTASNPNLECDEGAMTRTDPDRQSCMGDTCGEVEGVRVSPVPLLAARTARAWTLMRLRCAQEAPTGGSVTSKVTRLAVEVQKVLVGP